MVLSQLFSFLLNIRTLSNKNHVKVDAIAGTNRLQKYAVKRWYVCLVIIGLTGRYRHLETFERNLNMHRTTIC